MLALHGRLVGPLLAGYMLWDKAFAYLHVPGTPMYVGELVLLVGVLGFLSATGYLRVAVRDDPILALLGAYFLWGFIRFLPGLRTYGINAVRDFALVYYCLFAFAIAAALQQSPDILEHLIVQLKRFTPWLLAWLPIAVILGRSSTSTHGPYVPFSDVSIVTHKAGDAAIAAVVALGALWFFPSGRSARSRGLWSVVALIVFALVTTQNRGGLLSAVAGITVGLAFFRDRMKLIVRAVAAGVLLILIGTLLSLQIAGSSASQGRAFSTSQLFSSVASITGAQVSGSNLNGTVQGRTLLWTETIDKVVSDDKLVSGYGFGVNLAYLAGGAQASGSSASDQLRSPHNSYLDILARMGVIGASLWLALWVGWSVRLVRGCRRLAERGLYNRRRVAVLCMMVNAATMVSTFFDPQLEGAQAAVLLWVAFGIGLVVTSFRGPFGDRDLSFDGSTVRSVDGPAVHVPDSPVLHDRVAPPTPVGTPFVVLPQQEPPEIWRPDFARGWLISNAVRQAGRRISWGVADQAMSSLSNFAVNIYIARTLGAVQYGAFSLAYVTYAFALNASRGLATDPLLVRFSATDLPIWRRAVARCTGTAIAVGIVIGTCVLAVTTVLSGPTRLAFLALGLTLPGLLLQDSWRFSFFALGRGSQAFLNDTIWTVTLIPTLVLLRATGHRTVFWFVFAWGAAACIGAAVGPLQARVVPRLSGAREWLVQHRDLGLRYLAEGTTNSTAIQVRSYSIGLILGLAAVGYIQAANTLMGPFTVIFFGMGLVALPEAARLLQRSPRHLRLFCMLMSAGLTLLGLTWGVVLLVALPRGLGAFALGHLWRPTYPLVLPATLYIMGGCISAGAGTGLHALGAARRSLRAMMLSSAVYVALALVGAVTGGVVGAMYATAVATWIGSLQFWWQLRAALREHGKTPIENRLPPERQAENSAQDK